MSKPMSHLDNIPSTPGKFKMEKSPFVHNRLRWHSSLAKLAFWSFIFLGLILIFFFRSPPSNPLPQDPSRRSLRTYNWGGPAWEKRVRSSARARSRNGISVLVTGAAGFVARQALLERSGVFIVEGDINDSPLLKKLFEVVAFSHVMHLAAQAGVRYAMENPSSYVHSNIAGLVSLLEICKSANPQPAIVWASSSSVYGLNTKVPFSEKDRTDQPASLYAATKKAGEEIAHTYNHIYGLSLTGLRFFTVYGPWGRPDMAYFFFTRDILKGKSIPIFEAANHGTVARDFTYIDDIVKGCLAALDTAEKSTGNGGKKKGPAQLRVYNLGNTSPVPVSDLVSILERVLKVNAKREIMKLPRNGDVQFTHANISLARRELGYKPSTDLQTGLKKFVRWYLSYYSCGEKAAS
ncbi:UDP-glucuronate 4-epimerase 5 [Hibiscus syriacus]|uniref:UDP-glucuronate 4-epimerase n=1 Tax=Hibiscus syriacus TaxID=106335 RepID=A0A6A2WWP9_HIBSY|nr:UDP-glucuronate 4-epimerase 5 [Hibiscus syriacus]